jgi:putative hydrolase of the HAD superfamily
MIKAVVFDFDDVLRKWNSEETFAIESHYGLVRGSIFERLSDPNLIQQVTTGQISHDQWCDVVADQLTDTYGDGARTAVLEWSERIGDLDLGMMVLLRDLRSYFTIALLSNATSRLNSDLTMHGIAEDFDHVFNSSEIGHAKPDIAIFEYVGRSLGLEPGEWLFIDDIASNVDAASAYGVHSHVFRNQRDLTEWLRRETGLEILDSSSTG